MTANNDIKTNWPSVNRLLGSSEKFTPGTLTVVGGVSQRHTYETLIDLFAHAYAAPATDYFSDKDRPTVMFMVYWDNVPFARERIRFNLNAIAEDKQCTFGDVEEASRHGVGREVDDTASEIDDLFRQLDHYREKGNLLAVYLDDPIELFYVEYKLDFLNRLRDYAQTHNLVIVITHPLSGDMHRLKETAGDAFLETVSTLTQSPWSDGEEIRMAVDLELLIDTVEVDGQTQLGIRRGKHRAVETLPEEGRCVYVPFTASENHPEIATPAAD